jgi:hypothetical protein
VNLREVSLREVSLREVEPQRKGYMSFRGRAKRSYSVPNPGGFLDWLPFKSGIRRPTRLRAKGKNQAGEEGNTINLRGPPPLLRHPETLNQIRN